MGEFGAYLRPCAENDIAVQRALVEAEEPELALALVGLDDASRNIFLRNMSERGKASLLSALARAEERLGGRGPAGAGGPSSEVAAARAALAARLEAASRLPPPR